MKNLLKLEEFFLFGLSILLFANLDYPWWLYIVFFFAPDVSMVGYLGGPKIGAILYNFIHHKALAIGIYMIGIILTNSVLQFTGLILLGHTSLDRVLGYGLKYPESFQSTHLGRIGKQ